VAKRIYHDGCAIAHAMNLIGERWSVLVVRDLLLGPKRFTDLEAGLPGAGPNVLTQRLQHLEAAGVIRRRTLPPPGAARVYELTDWGAELGSALAELARWSLRSPIDQAEGAAGTDSLMLGLRTFFRPPRGRSRKTVSGVIDFAIGVEHFAVEICGDGLEVRRGQPPEPDASLATDATTMGRLLGGTLRLDEAIRDGAVHAEGKRALITSVLAGVTLPAPGELAS
jgi:DNA-binding HxlR family transcriptional regulator